MFITEKSSKALLRSSQYLDPQWFEIEHRLMKENCWSFGCLKSDIAVDNQIFATSVSKVPLVFWNQKGKIRCFRNICLHRACKIKPNGKCRDSQLVCQYHGWTYGQSGQLDHIPDEPDFNGFNKKRAKLIEYRIQEIGEIIFVALNSSTPSLETELGDTYKTIHHFFSNHKLMTSYDLQVPANWKIVLENTIESYHVPVIHPRTFKIYRPEKWHLHSKGKLFSQFVDLKPDDQSFSSIITKMLSFLTLSSTTTNRMSHIHVFPNLLFYLGDVFSVFYLIDPIEANRSHFKAYFFMPKKTRFPILSNLVQFFAIRAIKKFFKQILLEDCKVLEDIQLGLKNTQQLGILGRREERILFFHEYMKALEEKQRHPDVSSHEIHFV